MSQTQILNPKNPDIDLDKALRSLLSLLGLGLLSLLGVGYLAFFQIKQWQMVVLFGVVAVYLLIVLLSIPLINRGYSRLVGWGLIVGYFVFFLAVTLLLEGFGVVFAVVLAMVVTISVTQILPASQSIQGTIGGAVAIIALVWVDALEMGYRLSVPQLQMFLSIVVAGLGVIFVLFIARTYVNYSLRAKLIVAFILVSISSIVAVSFFLVQSTQNIVTTEINRELRNVAAAQSLSVGNLLTRQIEILRSLASDAVILNELQLVNTIYSNDPTGPEQRLARFAQKWEEELANGQGPLLSARMNNGVVNELKKIQQLFPDHSDILVSDKYGGLLAATIPVDDYNDSDEMWWQSTHQGGQGSVHISQPTLDEDSSEFGIIISVPIFDKDGNFAGVLRSVYNAGSLAKLINALSDPTQGVQAALLFPNGRILNPTGTALTDLPAGVFEQVTDSAQEYDQLMVNGQPQLFSQAVVQEIAGEYNLDRLGWRYLLFRDANQAMQPVQTLSRQTNVLAVIIIAVVIGVAVLLSDLVSKPILRLTAITRRITGGDLSSRAKVETKDEIGMLASNFNTMANQLEITFDTLEERVTERTRQLETVEEISRHLTGILDLSPLLEEVVTLIKEKFGYYHTHIYLLNQRTETLVMEAGYGEAGAAMKRQGHSILMSAAQSLVARAARNSQVITVEDVRANPAWLPNPLLPETQSEMAVPVKLGDTVVGVLDVQSDKVGGLTPADETALLALAQQVGIAVHNARMFSETRQALEQVQKIQGQYTGQAWEKFIAEQPTEFEVRRADAPPLAETALPELTSALQLAKTVWTDPADLEDGVQALATPLKLRNQVIGVLGLRDEEHKNRRWTEDEIALIEAVSEQMSLAIESARLFEETGRRAGREKTIANITQKVWAASDLEQLMQATVQQLGVNLDASRVIIRLGTVEQLTQNNTHQNGNT